ncbi:MAG: DUF465 domain-containing protein [Pseudomonadota bacterium]
MALEAHLETLAQRHVELETAIASELKHPAHDDIRLQELKRQKLKIKDEIETLRQSVS